VSVTYANREIFGSGPHRVTRGPRVVSLVPNFAVDRPGAGTMVVGVAEWEVVVAGRLVAADVAGLMPLRAELAALITDPPTVAKLEMDAVRGGESLADMMAVRVEETGPVVVGRVASVGYRAVFRQKVE
jgi:hypothetical protein